MTDSTETTLGPGLLAVTPGTDFVTFATGGGANIEDMPSYLADPQRQTGNLPGVARSNFVNRALRQGAFGMAGVSTFIWQVLSIYVPDDGNLDNWVANFKAALQAYITPGGTLPGGPYLPLAGGTMSGNINFQAGATTILANNTFLRSLDSGGTAHGLIRMGTDSNTYISDGTSPLVIFGSTPTVGSGIYWSARDTGGTNHSLLGIPADNNTYLNAFNNLYVNASTLWTNCNVVLPNNSSYYGKNAAAAPVALLGVNTSNVTQIALGAPGETWVYTAAGARIVLNGAVTVVGTLSPAGAVAIGGTLNVAGNVVFSAMLQVNGATNLYARLNVNGSVGATITGDILTNSLHVTGGVQIDNGANISGTTNIVYLQVYGAGANDPLLVQADSGHNARTRYNVSGTRLWSAGTDYLGRYAVADESAGAYRFYIDTGGNAYFTTGTLTVQYLTAALDAHVNRTCYIGTAGYGIYDAGSGWLATNSNWTTGYISSSGNITAAGNVQGGYVYSTGNLDIAGSMGVAGNFNCSNQVSSNTIVANNIRSNGDLTGNGNGYIGNNLGVGAHLTASNGFCLGGSGFNFDYTWSAPIGNHMQFVGGLGIYAQFFSAYSDAELKRNVAPVEHDALAAIRPFKFFSYDSPRVTPEGEVIDERSHVAHGFLAQQVQESLPGAIIETEQPTTFHMDHPESGAVGCDFDTRPVLAVDMMTMLAYALRAIQQLDDRIEQLKGGSA